MEINSIDESILSIKNIDIKGTRYSSNTYIGYQIITNQRILSLLIDNEQQCCEDVGRKIVKDGTIITEDNISDFLGARINSINIIEKDYTSNSISAFEHQRSELYEGYCLFINFETSNGLLQFVLYNDHNGYYGHTAKITQSIPVELFSFSL